MKSPQTYARTGVWPYLVGIRRKAVSRHLAPAFIAETGFCLWLIVKGVNGDRWDQMTRSAARPS